MANSPFAIERARKITIQISGYDAQAATRLQRQKQREHSERMNRQRQREQAPSSASNAGCTIAQESVDDELAGG